MEGKGGSCPTLDPAFSPEHLQSWLSSGHVLGHRTAASPVRGMLMGPWAREDTLLPLPPPLSGSSSRMWC